LFLLCISILTHDIDIANLSVSPSVRPSVRPSVPVLYDVCMLRPLLLLFLIFMNDLEDNVASNVLMFADDTKLYGTVDDVLHGQMLQQDLGKIADWAVKWQMTFNVEKCKVVHYGKDNIGFNPFAAIMTPKDVMQCRGVMCHHDVYRRHIPYYPGTVGLAAYSYVLAQQTFCLACWAKNWATLDFFCA